MFNFYSKNKKGFTLVELLVSMTLLSIVLVITLGLLMTVNAQVRRTRAQRRVMDNVTFAIEHMSRSIAYGHDYSCIVGGAPMSCGFNMGGTQVLYFNGLYLGFPTNITFERRVSSSTGRGYIARTIGSGNPISITDENVDITELTFYVYHGDPFVVDKEQPRIVVSIRGISYASSTPQQFFIQTTLSQRDLKS